MLENPNDIVSVILCAGKGTRMNDTSKNKVCSFCAGKPVIRHIIENMRTAGIEKFVLVVGHQAQSVMDCLADETGLIYAYQGEQRGTGHAVQCGLQVLEKMGFTGKAIVSMGDKIVASGVIRELIKQSFAADILWGVQPVSVNPQGGRIIEMNGVPCGVVELADIAYQTLAGLPKDKWQEALQALGLNATKMKAVISLAEHKQPGGRVCLNGHKFSVEELCQSRYANAGLYCLGIQDGLDALAHVNSNNAQGEIYMTDALEYLAPRKQVKLFEVSHPEDMMTFNTKPELRTMSRQFIRPASVLLGEIAKGGWNSRFKAIYNKDATVQYARYRALLEAFVNTYGDRPVIITRAPGRLNLMGRHIDHRGGCTNVMVIGNDTLMACSPRHDDIVHIANLYGIYPEREFSISTCMELGKEAVDWLSYLDSDAVKASLAAERGDWVTYIKSAVLRFQMAMDFPLCGMDVMVTGNIPSGAGLSSSSALVVAMGEALVGLNCLNLTDRQFVDLCGEGEWYVGSRGGAGDHAAMKYGCEGQIVQLKFKPFDIGQSYPWPDGYGIIVAESGEQAKKSEGSRDAFNARVATYEFGFMLMRKRFAQYGWREFRELADITPQREIYRMLQMIPERATRDELYELLPTQHEKLQKLFATHTEPAESYDLRGILLYGISECLRAQQFGTLLENEDYEGIGELMKISHDGDRLVARSFSDDVLEELYRQNADVAKQCGAYACSTERIDALCDLLNSMDGVLGSSLVGAGLGGSVIALVRKEAAEEILNRLKTEFYWSHGLSMLANYYVPSAGSSVIW